jgi:hypothetical protein
MYGLTVRWSLTEAPAGALESLRDYVEHESFAKFETADGLRFKTWRASESQWFEGLYVFDSDESRDRFQRDFEAIAANAPANQFVGAPPTLVEPCMIVAVAEGPSGFRSAARFEA